MATLEAAPPAKLLVGVLIYEELNDS